MKTLLFAAMLLPALSFALPGKAPPPPPKKPAPITKDIKQDPKHQKDHKLEKDQKQEAFKLHPKHR